LTTAAAALSVELAIASLNVAAVSALPARYSKNGFPKILGKGDLPVRMLSRRPPHA